ncbi:MAG TPA: hypothetical protein DCQ06_02665 [Myxococcales bacterium]|nr:hypothetical protein [Myxococcales bacterium]HAN30477.1 hypothetical protein [Myxococcales bacterium]
MKQYLVALDQLPVADVSAIADAWLSVMGGVKADITRQLRSTNGVLAENLDLGKARALHRTLNRGGCRCWALPQDMIPRPPKPRVASKLDLSDPKELRAQISLTGPPETIPWSKVVLALPAVVPLERHRMVANRAPSVGIGRVALAVSTGIGAKRVMGAVKQRVKGGPEKLTETNRHMRRVIEIWRVGPWGRIQGYQDHLDYSVLQEQSQNSMDNFLQLIDDLQQHLSPKLAGQREVALTLKQGDIPAHCYGDDNNGVGAIGRWLLIRSAAMRIAAQRS